MSNKSEKKDCLLEEAQKAGATVIKISDDNSETDDYLICFGLEKLLKKNE